MGKESAKKIMGDILANSPEFAAQMEAARKVETGESDKPVIVKLTGRFDNPQITNETVEKETMAEKPIDVINRLSGRDKPPVSSPRFMPPSLHGQQLAYLNEWERKYEEFLKSFFDDLYSSNMEEDEMDTVVGYLIDRTDVKEEWGDYKDNVEDEVPGQEIRDYPQSFLE